MLKPAARLDFLTAARGFAAFAVVFYHIDAYLDGAPSGAGLAFIHRGALGVDFFFILSGFILAHVYGADIREGTFKAWPYLAKRFARIYPLHLATFIAVAALYIVGARFGFAPERPQHLSAFAAHGVLLHAFGATDAHYFNQPSWSVSAEWGAYLFFPLIAPIFLKRHNWPLAFALYAAAMWTASSVYGQSLFALTFEGGWLRIIPSFAAGVALKAALDGCEVPRPAMIAGVAAAGLLGVMQTGLPDAVAVACFIPLIAGLAALRNGAAPRALVHLGEISYSLYLVHAPILMITFGLARKLLDLGQPLHATLASAVAIAAMLAAAQIAYGLIEVPCRRRVADWLIRKPAHPLAAE